MKTKAKIIASLFTMLFFLIGLRVDVFAFSSGNGTAASPFIITTPAHVNQMRSHLNAHFRLGNDINMSGINHVPIGTFTQPFRGVLDGNGHAIRYLMVNAGASASGAGLFEVVDSAAIRNLTLEHVNISGTINAAALVGHFAVNNNQHPVSIYNVGVSGTINATHDQAGSIVGTLSAISGQTAVINRVRSTAEINAVNNSGGLIGHVSGRIHLTESYFAGEITGNGGIGGLIGNSRNTNNISNGSIIENSFSIGKLTATGNSSIGGLIGNPARDTFQIINSYSASELNTLNISLRNGLAPNGVAAITNSFFDGRAAGRTNGNLDPNSRLTSGLMFRDTFTNWDFDNIWTINEGSSYPFLRNLPKPEKATALPIARGGARGRGTADDPYIISEGYQLQDMTYDISAHFRLGNDIDMAGIEFVPIPQFNGELDGNGHAIRNLTVHLPHGGGGLFNTTGDAVIQNINFEDVNFYSDGGSVALVGNFRVTSYESPGFIDNVSISGAITAGGSGSTASSMVLDLTNVTTQPVILSRLHSSATLTSPDQTGGLIRAIAGRSVWNGGEFIGVEGGTFILSESHFSGEIITDSSAGGLINFTNAWDNGSEIRDSFSTGRITSSNSNPGFAVTGLIVSSNSSLPIINSFSASELSGLYRLGLATTWNIVPTNSFFDAALAGVETPEDQARTTAQMMQRDTFAGWDFDNVWDIIEGHTYPFLRNVSTAPPIERPANITGLICTEQTISTLGFSWDTMANIDYFEISFDGQTSTQIENTARFDGLDGDVSYTFMVRAVRGGIYGNWAYITVYTVDNSLNAPENLVVTGRTSNSISLSWDAVNNATEYIVNYNGQSIAANTNSITIRNLASDTEYIITVQARNTTNISPRSLELSVRTYRAPYAPVTNLRHTGRTNSSITLVWNPVIGVTTYQVRFGENIISVTDNTVIVSDLSPGTSYTFAARAYSSDNVGEWSSPITVSTLRGPSALYSEILLNAQNTAVYEIVLSGDNVFFDGDTVFNITYDPEVIRLLDFASQVPGAHTGVGVIPGTNIQILSISSGNIEFRFLQQLRDDQVWSGIFTIARFQALRTRSTTIVFEQ
ncbi:MAG: fibronectin type III domain-containing protein [Defluviitaleaceae bacterium]|nr:fibronectin type III domain-containing protein [Defluviitaleaceae bacterium]